MLDANPLDDLPTRLEQVLRLLAAGKRNKEIAQELGYSTNTIRNYVSELLELSSCQVRPHWSALSNHHGVVLH
jgi:two-component system nitrate/nitrite response regulator NarL